MPEPSSEESPDIPALVGCAVSFLVSALFIILLVSMAGFLVSALFWPQIVLWFAWPMGGSALLFAILFRYLPRLSPEEQATLDRLQAARSKPAVSAPAKQRRPGPSLMGLVMGAVSGWISLGVCLLLYLWWTAPR